MAAVRVLKFVVTGGINTAVNYLIFVVLIKIGVYYLIASSIGYLVALCFSYSINKRWTFNSTNSSSFFMVLKFIAINLMSLLTNLFFVFLFFEQGEINIYISQALAIIFGMFINYFGYKYIFFSDLKS